MEFEGKSYLIVGASSGVGLSIAQKLVEKGAEVFTTSRDVNKNFPGKKIELNISDDLSHLSSQLPERLNGLVYCPGTINLKPFSRLTDRSKLSGVAPNQFGKVLGFSTNTLNFSVTRLFSETFITSFTETWNEAISTLVPFTRKCPWFTNCLASVLELP